MIKLAQIQGKVTAGASRIRMNYELFSEPSIISADVRNAPSLLILVFSEQLFSEPHRATHTDM